MRVLRLDIRITAKYDLSFKKQHKTDSYLTEKKRSLEEP